jgi:RNA polymerase sigma-70 factor (ECF subfamily)
VTAETLAGRGRRLPAGNELSVAWLIAVAWHKRLDILVARDVLAALGPHHRAVLTLRYLDGLPVAEVAACLDRTINGTEALLTRAKSAFRKSYAEHHGARGTEAGDE